MARMNDNARPKGTLALKVIRDGEVISETRSNLIVNTGRNALAKLLGGETGMHVTQVGVGTGGDAAAESDTDITDPIKVDVTETRIGEGLESEDGGTFDDVRIVQFHFSFGLATAVGVAISEYGLYCADGTLFSRVVRDTPFTKTSVDKIVGYWQITF